jgi:serine-type D-Ala-D-Ala carboxypeptidase (penicillin-binding protein 5/6)
MQSLSKFKNGWGPRMNRDCKARPRSQRFQFVLVLLLSIVIPFSVVTSGAASQADAANHQRFQDSGFTVQFDEVEVDYRSQSLATRWTDSLVRSQIDGFTANAAIAVDLTSGTLLYSRNADWRVAPASTLKIVTAITAAEILDPDREVEVAASDLVDPLVYSNASLMAGDIVTVRDLIAGTLVPSGGDAAQALAREAAFELGIGPNQDPMERFTEEMNHVAVRLGMTNSSFRNPVGSDQAEQHTSARDMALAGEALLRNGVLRDMVASESWQIDVRGPNARSYWVMNTNQFIGLERVHGVKTGTTGLAGECLILLTERGGNRILTVVMGSQARYQDTQLMLNQIDQELSWIEFGASSHFPGVQSAAERFDIRVASPLVRPVRKDELRFIYARVELGPRPASVSTTVWGRVVFLYDGDVLYRAPLLSRP